MLTCYIANMNREPKRFNLLSQLSAGEVYSWSDLEPLSGSLGRDLKQLQEEGYLRKVGPGMYLLPKKNMFGAVPASPEQVVSTFLKTEDFLIFTPNLYNGLGLGLTQLKNLTFVYNKKRHGTFKLGNRNFEFKLKPKGFPRKLTQEYLLVELVNNLEDTGELPSLLLDRVVQKLELHELNNKKIFEFAKLYGHVYTKKFFDAIEQGTQYPVKMIP